MTPAEKLRVLAGRQRTIAMYCGRADGREGALGTVRRLQGYIAADLTGGSMNGETVRGMLEYLDSLGVLLSIVEGWPEIREEIGWRCLKLAGVLAAKAEEYEIGHGNPHYAPGNGRTN